MLENTTQKLLKIFIGLNIFVGAFLSFLIQPIITKKLIFEFGGSASVWNVSLAFFTTVLVAGYLYAEFLSKKNLKQIILIHSGIHLTYIIFLILKITLLPDFVKNTFSPENSIYFGLIKVLTLETGLLSFATAGNSIVMQLIISRLKIDKNIYKLYSLSNAGSLIGLLIFPLILEPNIGIIMMTKIIYGVFIIFAFTNFYIAKNLYNKSENKIQIKNTEYYKIPLKIIALSFISMSTMVATTTHLTMDLASMPLIWIVPLAIYLISFILGFIEYKNLKRAQIYIIAIIPITIFNFLAIYLQGFAKVLVINLSLLAILTVLHNIIYTNRPKQEHLSKYYLAIAIGGSLASITSAYIFPIIFNNFYEYTGFTLISILIIYYVFKYKTITETPFKIFNIRNTISFVFLIFATSFPLFQFAQSNRNIKSSYRDFYGVAQIKEESDYKMLIHNLILHGLQNKQKPKLATAYYGEHSPLFEYFAQNKTKNKKILAVGLGIGTINTYCDDFSEIMFLEINQKIIEIAKNEFTYLDQCKRKPQIYLGDARKIIETKLIKGNIKYDAIILDAFSGDNIPAHLLTKEAFDLYTEILANDGQIFIHISNKYLDLTKILTENKLKAYNAVNYKNNDKKLTPGEYKSEWVILYKSDKTNTSMFETEIFTDDKNSLLQLLR